MPSAGGVSCKLQVLTVVSLVKVFKELWRWDDDFHPKCDLRLLEDMWSRESDSIMQHARLHAYRPQAA